MEAIPIPLTTAPETDEKRPCIRIKARIKIQGEQQSLTPSIEATRSYQAYCETVTSSRSQTPDIFTTPPTHSQPFQPTQLPHKPTYTARITTRKATTSSASPRSYRNPRLQHVALPDTSSGSSSETDIVAHRVLSQGSLTVQQARTPCSNPANGAADRMSRNRTLSLSQVQPANIVAEATQHHTPLKQKRYGRMHMEYQPMPTLPPSPPESPTIMLEEKPLPSKTTVNFSRGEISPKPLQIQKEVKASHRACGNVFTPTSELTSSAQDMNTIFVRAEEERPRSKASKRTVTFADDTTISSRSSSPVYHTHDHEQIPRQSRSFTSEAQIPSSLRLYRSHDSLLAAGPLAHEEQGTNATRRTAPKDFKHRYPFGERPASRIAPPPSLGRVSNANYNPRLSTSKAQYRGLASLPRPLPSSLRITQPQTGPRQPPWGSLGDLEEQREKRVDARERDQAKQFRAATLSEATTLASADSFGKDRMKKEVEDYREQVMSVYPDMAFDGNAGKGGRGCCCAVM